jgi:hypothetical protein
VPVPWLWQALPVSEVVLYQHRPQACPTYVYGEFTRALHSDDYARKNHEWAHTEEGDRPFGCPVGDCQQRCIRKADLISHLDVSISNRCTCLVMPGGCVLICVVTIQRHVTSGLRTADLLSYKKQVSTMEDTTGGAHAHFPAAAGPVKAKATPKPKTKPKPKPKTKTKPKATTPAPAPAVESAVESSALAVALDFAFDSELLPAEFEVSVEVGLLARSIELSDIH